MAFNFNWSPLTADSDFYAHARELLTTGLNKAPKPPIIVDDILVNELNLGSVPPELEILEIGDLAEDRFRGIFKMCYSGDAFLTLKTRVQANPLNTYLSTKPSFASPQPLAASSGLTIPLQITLSDIKLSAFIILVFSRQKGLTLVFRNDPLESLKVSSTFDSIPFVRDYLQKEIEGQLRDLLMEEVPAIIHRLSLRLWVPEYGAKDEQELTRRMSRTADMEKPIDPLASPPQNPVDPSESIFDASEISSLSLDSGSENHSSFSQKNLLRLAALTDSHRTLSLFTPSIRDTVFRAWAGPTERGDAAGTSTPVTPMMPSLSRAHSHFGSTSSTYTFSDHSDNSSYASRPTLTSYGSAATGLSMGASRHGKTHTGRKKKTRVVNLRRKSSHDGDTGSISGESTNSTAASSVIIDPPAVKEREEELVTPPRTPNNRVRFRKSQDSIDIGDTPPRLRPLTPIRKMETPKEAKEHSTPAITISSGTPQPQAEPTSRPLRRPSHHLHHVHSYTQEKGSLQSSSSQRPPQYSTTPLATLETPTGGILEQAWMLKMAGEIARRVQDEKAAGRVTGGLWERGERDDTPPPAYGL
ncbi:MAG: ERMES complex subunit [Pycnora praestabilis]|nr:MAG: ERMES complex subunit [Pycnora praestabilis]